MFTVLFICTGNTCRSPMAKSFLDDMVRADGWQKRVRVESAGLAAYAGDVAAPEAIDSLRRLGVQTNRHLARHLEGDIVQAADLVLTMTESHRRELVRRFPTAAERTWVLGEFVGRPGDVPDPVGGGAVVYDSCAAFLRLLLGQAWLQIRQMAGNNRVDGERIG